MITKAGETSGSKKTVLLCIRAYISPYYNIIQKICDQRAFNQSVVGTLLAKELKLKLLGHVYEMQEWNLQNGS